MKKGETEYHEVTTYLNKEIKRQADEKKVMHDMFEVHVLFHRGLIDDVVQLRTMV